MQEIHTILQDLRGFTDIAILLIVIGFAIYTYYKSQDKKTDLDKDVKLKEVENKGEMTALEIISSELKSLREEVNKNTLYTIEVNKSVNNKKADEPTIREDVRAISGQVHNIDKKLDSHIGVFFEKFSTGDLRFKQLEERINEVYKHIGK